MIYLWIMFSGAVNMLKLKLCVLCLIGCLLCGLACANLHGTIPVIDMHDYFTPGRREIFVENLAKAMQTVGFVAVINSRVDTQVLDDAYMAAKRFYAKPTEHKMQYHNPALNGQRGYVQSEVAKGNNVKDFKEFYLLAPEYPQSIRQEYNYLDNIWPTDAGFKEAMQKLIVELDHYSVPIAQALAQGLHEEPDYFVRMTRHGATLLRSIHYPAHPPQNTVWAAAHTDIDLFTILPRATAEGLQILNQHGEWIDVIVPDNAFIINAGDMLQNITNGLYKSAAHRVICKNPLGERYSMVMFIHPRLDDSVAPLAKYITQVGKQNFASVTARELLFERLIDLGLHSPALLQDFANSGAMERLIAVNRGSIAAMHALREANLASPIVLKTLSTQAH